MTRKFFLLLITIILTGLWNIAKADGIQISTSTDKPEHVYTLVNGNGIYANGNTGTTQTADNYGQFAFFASDLDGAYQIYSLTAKKWLSYTRGSSYSAKTNFVTLAANRPTYGYFNVNEYTSGLFEIQPYTSGNAVAGIYLNWYKGVDANPLDDASVRLGLWTENGAKDKGSRWTITEVIHIDPVEPVKPNLPANLGEIRAKYGTKSYTLAEVYPTQQAAVGEAMIAQDNGDTLYTLYNNVLAATFVLDRGHLFFGGSDAMNLEAGTEPFTIAVGGGTTIPSSAMEMKLLRVENLVGSNDSIGGAEHFNGKALEAEYEYPYGESTLGITWRAVLRDGSHYLRTEMELKGNGDVKMFNVIPLIYNVNTTNAGSTPAVVGNTRGAVLMSDKIFAGLENPVGYNTVGDAEGESEKYNETSNTTAALTSGSWTQMAQEDVPARVVEATGKNYPNIYEYKQSGVELNANQKVVVTIAYKSGNNRLNFGGVDLLDASGSVAANDYHSGYSGTASSKNTFTFIVPNDGSYTIRAIAENGTEAITASSDMTVTVYTPKEGAVITGDFVPIQGRWSRNTTLQDGETWKISGVVGLVAQDVNSKVANYNLNQKRRSFLAYSERERAVPWRCSPSYISWYELNIDRNNAAPGSEATNMQADEVIDVENQWYKNFYKPYKMGPANFVIDDGWDNYGTWTFHTAFPNEMRDISALASKMGAGVGAWLGPVGGYGQSGNYRRKYWTDLGQSMVLGNPNYYKVFKDAATNLVNNQGTKTDGHKSFEFFKFDGISAQFSAVGPDEGDSGNENAEGIIRLERFVREELERDIFFNTTVGTWASPFWYHYTDATWRQENDYGTIGDNSIDREKWITYRDRLVYQNYVQNSPICPINTLMTHGFILTKFGAVSKNMDYDACLRELRCAFACGSGMVELYNDYSLMNSINNGHLWCDLANLIQWQKANADVLPDSHWVGGNPWDGSNENIYGWGAWNKDKAVLTLRNGDDGSASKSITLTLREALNVPAEITGKVNLKKCWEDQVDLKGWPADSLIDVDQSLTLTLPKNSVYMFSTAIVNVEYVEPQAQGITDLSQLSNDSVYVLRTQRGFALYNDAVPESICGSKGTAFTAPAESYEDENQQFQIIKKGTNYYLYSVGAQKYVGASGNYTTGQSTTFKMEKSGNASYPWKLYLGSYCMNMQEANNKPSGMVVNNWTTTDAGNCYYIEAAVRQGPTGISEIKNDRLKTTDVEAFDLTGRKADAGHGVFISDGKVVVR